MDDESSDFKKEPSSVLLTLIYEIEIGYVIWFEVSKKLTLVALT